MRQPRLKPAIPSPSLNRLDIHQLIRPHLRNMSPQRLNLPLQIPTLTHINKQRRSKPQRRRRLIQQHPTHTPSRSKRRQMRRPMILMRIRTPQRVHHVRLNTLNHRIDQLHRLLTLRNPTIRQTTPKHLNRTQQLRPRLSLIHPQTMRRLPTHPIRQNQQRHPIPTIRMPSKRPTTPQLQIIRMRTNSKNPQGLRIRLGSSRHSQPLARIGVSRRRNRSCRTTSVPPRRADTSRPPIMATGSMRSGEKASVELHEAPHVAASHCAWVSA